MRHTQTSSRNYKRKFKTAAFVQDKQTGRTHRRGQTGIYSFGTGDVIANNTVSFHNTSVGIWIGSSGNLTIKDNSVNDNYCGIQLGSSNAQNVTITGNEISSKNPWSSLFSVNFIQNNLKC